MVYAIPNATIPVNRIYGEGIYELTKGEFDKFSIETDAKININERTGIINIFINQVSFCFARYINYPLYLKCDADTSAQMQECFKRKANVEVCRTSKRTRSSVRSSGFFHIPALRNIRKGEDLFMNYGDNHPIKYDQHPETLSDMEEDIDTAGASAVDEKE